MRIVFMGTPEFGVPSLKALYAEGHQLVGVFCQPDKPKGRGKKLTPCPVKEWALAHDIPVFQPKRIRLDGAEDLRALAPDLCVTAAFGQILSEDNLSVPRLGTVNVHASLLPKYRGSAPINWALISGEKVTGVTTMLTDKGMDTGDMLLSEPFSVPDGMTAGELTETLSHVGAELLIKTIRLLESGTCPRQKQDESQMTYFPMLKKEMGQIDFSVPAEQIVNLVRGVNPWPGAYTYLDGEPLKIWRAAAIEETRGAPYELLCADAHDGLIARAGEGAVVIEELQAAGGKRMNARDYLRGHPVKEMRFVRKEENDEQ